MAIIDLDGVVAGGKPPVGFLKVTATSGAAGRFFSFWRVAGDPVVGAIPTTSATVCDKDTIGAMSYTHPTAPDKSYLAGASANLSISSTLILYDRLLHCGGLNATLTTPQTVGGATVTRSTQKNQMYLEVYTAIGGTTANITVSYTNQSGVSGRATISTVTFSFAPAGQMILLPLQEGDTGVQSIQSVTLSASTGTVGNFGITVLRPIVMLGCVANVEQAKDALTTYLPEIEDNSCLSLMMQCGTSATGSVVGSFWVTQG